MKISLATNFDDSLIDKVKEYPIYEVYGKLKKDIGEIIRKLCE